MIQAFKDNPILICKCGGKFRKYGIDRNGNNREYTQCMNCTLEDFGKQIGKYKQKEGYASMKDATESEDIEF